jgi:hypothetical protein
MSAPRERRRPLDGAVNPNAETASQQGPVADDEANRHERIAKAAYYNAERRGFEAGGEQDDWLAAEKEIDAQHRQQARPSRRDEGSARARGAIDVEGPDHMVAREPLPAGQPHDPVPPAEKGSRKPERRTRAR